jgi:hypothetical protein
VSRSRIPASAASAKVCRSRSGVRCVLWGSPRPKAGGVPAGSPRTGCTWAFGRCGEWGHLPRPQGSGGACRASRRGEPWLTRH